MCHDMAPLDPYGGGGGAKTKSIPPIGRMTAHPPKVVGAGISEANTGGEWAGSLYKPSYGNVQRGNRRKGYFNNPDKDAPRKPPRGAAGVKDNRRGHILGMKASDMPPRADPVKGQPDVLGKCLRASDIAGNRYYTRTAENDWVPVGTKERGDRSHAALFQIDAKEHIAKVATQRATERAARLEEKRKDKAAIEIFDPWDHPGAHHKKFNRVGLDVAQAKFDETNSSNSYVGAHFGKDGGGAPIMDKLTNTVKTGMPYDAETHLRNAYKSTQNSGDAVMTYSRREHYVENKAYGAGVRAQMEADKLARRRKREKSDLGKVGDHGMVSKLGKAGGGAPNRTSSGKVNTKVQGGLDKPDGCGQRDVHLASEHRRMITENEHRRKVDKIPQRYDKFEKFDPFEKSSPKRDVNGRIKGTKAYTVKGVGLVAPNVIIEGATIANVMGTPGGGTRHLVGTHMPAAMGVEEYEIEMTAQREGKSMWGRPGGGGPLKRPDGTVETRTLGTAELEAKGITDARADPHYRSRINQIRAQQEKYILQKKEEVKRADATHTALEVKKSKEQFMGKSTNPHHTGSAIPERFTKPHVDLYGREKPQANMDIAHALDDQIAVRDKQLEAAKTTAREQDRTHIAASSKWQGSGAGQVRQGTDGRTTGRYQKDLSIHPDIRPEDNLCYSPEIRAKKEKYHDDLTKTAAQKKKVKKYNKARQAKEEDAHKRNDNKFLGRPGAGAPIRLKNGKIKTQRGGPPGDVEYKMMATQAAALL